jgi:hypothetical protein
MVYTPVGHLENLAYIAYFKRALVNFKLPADLQLKMLEHINRCVFGLVTAEAVAAIEPSCDVGAEMLNELNKVPRSEFSGAFRDGDVFRLLAKLNRRCCARWSCAITISPYPREGAPKCRPIRKPPQ